jgi:hypothetical protein
MNQEQPRHSKAAQLTGVMAAAAALIAAMSTLYVNVRNQAAPAATPEPAVTAAPAPSASVAAAPAAVAAEPVTLVLRLDRVQVENDGSMGTTDWNFEISAAGEPRFTLPMRALNDKPGHNLVRPPDPDQAATELKLAPDQQLKLDVRGWREGLLGNSGAEVGGSGWISGKADKATIRLGGEAAKSPAFTLYFTLAPKS